MKRILVMFMFVVVSLSFSVNAYCKNIGSWDLGGIWFKDKVNVMVIEDPKVKGVVCHVASIGKALSFEDPSNSSIACRQVGKIKIGNIDRSDKGEIVFSEKKSLLFKKMKVRRIYDASNKVLVYVTYVTKTIEGSYKVSISTVVVQ